jgi:hypothetical protein
VSILERAGKSNQVQHSLIRVLVHGDSGVGKTTSLKTLPPDQTLVCYAERSVLPLADAGFNVLKIESWDDLREIIGQFREPQKIDGKDIRFLVFDSLTELSDLCKKQIVEVDRKALITARTKGKSDTPDNIYDDLMQMEDWNAYGTRMRNMISAATKLPVNIIFTSLSTWSTDKKTGNTQKTVDLNGQIRMQAPQWFDLVVYMESLEQPMADGGKANVRVFRTFNDGDIVAKDASGKLDPIEPANWTHVFRKIKGASTAAQKKATKPNAAEPTTTNEQEKKEDAA